MPGIFRRIGSACFLSEGDLPMSVGAGAMSLSTIIVAANAQLLRRLTLQDAASIRNGSSEAAALNWECEAEARVRISFHHE